MISRICCGLLVVAVVALIQSAQAEDVRAIAENKIKLAKQLEKGYEKLLEPGNTTLKMGISIICAHYDLSEKRLHSRVFERYSWKDWRLQWDPSKYGGLRVIKIPANLIWTPDDVRLYNAFHESAHRDAVNAVILHDGTVYWIPSASYTTLCGPGGKLNDRKGHCHLKLGSWTYDAEDLPLILWEDGADTKFYLDDCPHVISNLEAQIKTTKYDCCPDPYASLEIDFDLEERKEFKSRDHGHQKKPKRRLGIDCEWPHCTVES